MQWQHNGQSSQQRACPLHMGASLFSRHMCAYLIFYTYLCTFPCLLHTQVLPCPLHTQCLFLSTAPCCLQPILCDRTCLATPPKLCFTLNSLGRFFYQVPAYISQSPVFLMQPQAGLGEEPMTYSSRPAGSDSLPVPQKLRGAAHVGTQSPVPAEET